MKLYKLQMVKASALWHSSLSLPLLLSHSPSYKLLMSHNLCMAVIRFNEVPTTLGWHNSAATCSLICDRAELSNRPDGRRTMQVNTGLWLSKLVFLFFHLKSPVIGGEVKSRIGKLEMERLSYWHSVVKFCSCNFPRARASKRYQRWLWRWRRAMWTSEGWNPGTSQEKTRQNFWFITDITYSSCIEQINRFV